MLTIAIYDSVDYKETNPEYPRKRMHKFSKVWIFDENQNKKLYENVLISAKNKSLNKFDLIRGRIYLIKASNFIDNELKHPSIIDKSSMIEFSENNFKIFTPGACQGLTISNEYTPHQELINQFIKNEFKNQNISDFTKYMWMVISEKNSLFLDRKIPNLLNFDKNFYIKNQINKHSKKIKKKKELPSTVQINLFSDLNNIILNDEFNGENLSDDLQKEDLVVENLNDILSNDETPLKIKKRKKPSKKFSNEDIEFIKNNRHLLNAKEIGEIIGKEYKTVIDKVGRLVYDGVFSKRVCVRMVNKSPSKIYKNNLVTSLKKFRNEKKLTQFHVAKILNVNNSLISYYENNKVEVSDSMYHKINYLIKNFDEMMDVIDFDNSETNKIKYEKLPTKSIQIEEHIKKVSDDFEKKPKEPKVSEKDKKINEIIDSTKIILESNKYLISVNKQLQSELTSAIEALDSKNKSINIENQEVKDKPSIWKRIFRIK